MYKQSEIVLERALVFGGSYGNLQATRAILAEAGRQGFKPHEVIFTGDFVAYCANPQETVDLVREFGCHIIQGNCEEALGSNADDCGCGFDEGSACDVLSAQWYRFCQANLNESTKRWMADLPKSLTVEIGSQRFLICHGTPARNNQFVFSSDIEIGSYAIPKSEHFDGYIVGHSGFPFIAEQNEYVWINSGAAGMPANDGTNRVWFATLTPFDNSIETELHALTYDHMGAANAMTEAGLDNGYRDCLTSGIWPSHDVLPPHEKQLTGIQIKAQKKALKRTPLTACV